MLGGRICALKPVAAMSETNPVPDPDIVHGWKAIGVVLGRSVRTVQRWERELGLPVHRIKTADGQTIYARKSELEAWRTTMDAAGQSVGTASTPPPPNISTETTSPPNIRRRILAIAAAVVLIAGAATYFALDVAGSTEVTSIRFEGGEVRGLDASESVVWSKPFGRNMRMAGSVRDVGPIRADLDGDGSDEFLLGLAPNLSLPDNHVNRPLDVLLCFRADGSLCGSASPHLTIACGDKTFTGPWQITSYMVVGPPSGRRVWMSVGHHTWWPGAVFEVDFARGAQPIYYQAGWVTSVAEWTVRGTRYLVAGGVLNGQERASLTFTPVDRLPAATPDVTGSNQCQGLATSNVERMLTVPSFDAQIAGAPYPMVTTLQSVGPNLKFRYGRIDEVVGELDPSFALAALGQTDMYWRAHEDHERAEMIKHPAVACPERNAHKTWSLWSTNTGWVTAPTPRSPR